MSFFVWMSVAAAATWPFRAPVPSAPPSDGGSFSVCLEVGENLGFDGSKHSDGNVSWTCESETSVSRVCYVVEATGWPEKWPRLSCEGPKHSLAVTLLPAFDPASTLEKGARISGKVDEVVAVFITGKRYPNQTVDGKRGARCVVTDGRLYVSRETPERRKDVCTLRVTGGVEDLKVRNSGGYK
jgi:hypothetical protein